VRKKIADRLGEILGGHVERERQRRRMKTRERSEEERLRKRWDRKVETVLLPVFEEFVERLEEDGHLGRVVAEERAVGEGTHHYGEVKLQVIPKRFRREALRDAETPSLTLELDEHRQIVLLSRSTVLGKLGGEEGLAGELELSAVSKREVEDRLLALIEQVFSK